MAGIEIDGNAIAGARLGDKIIYQSHGWRPVELAYGVTGNVCWRDVGDGTAELMGSIGFSVDFKGSNKPGNSGGLMPIKILNYPTGYKFGPNNWTVSGPWRTINLLVGVKSNGAPFMRSGINAQFNESSLYLYGPQPPSTGNFDILYYLVSFSYTRTNAVTDDFANFIGKPTVVDLVKNP